MGRVKFTKDIKYHTPFDDAILDYFDEIMILYDLVYEYKDINISTKDSDGLMAFTIVFESNDIASKVFPIINSRKIYKFNKVFESRAQHNNNEIYVEIISRRDTE